MKVLQKIFSTKNDRELGKLSSLVEKINALEAKMQILSTEGMQKKSEELKKRCLNGESQESLLPEAFALVREASSRTLKMRHFDVQLIGGIVLHQGKIAEMKTGEGKTLVATLAVYLHALAGRGTHVVTVNDHLAKRDAEWMRPIYESLGMSVGFITGNVEYAKKKEAYQSDITYGTNNEFGFDYLRDNMVNAVEDKVQREHHFAIVDEVDSILIDEARTPLIISGPSETNTEKYFQINQIIPGLKMGKLDEKGKEIQDSGDYVVDEKDQRISITESGVKTIEKMLGIDNLYSPQNSDFLHHVTQALRAHKLYQRDVHYLVEDGVVHIIDEFTGRKMHGRRFSNGLHQAIEAKENVNILSENQTIATTTLQNYFRLYKNLSGMTGTADTEAQEFKTIYDLDVVVIPTNRPIARIDHGDRIYKTEKEKFAAIANLVKEKHIKGQPVLIGTASVEKSEQLSNVLSKNKLPHELLNAKQHEREASIVEKSGERGNITIATNMAGRGTDIKLKEEIKKLGGLVVIGSERHEARRIDNQLRGRCGRQGDPGESIFFLSLDDNLMRRFYSEKMANILTKLGMKEGDEIEHPLITRQIEAAQRKVEARNFEIRKYLLEYDDVINSQRGYIYTLRDAFLKKAQISEEIYKVIETMAEEQLLIKTEQNRRMSPDLVGKTLLWLEKDFFLTDVREKLNHSDFVSLGFARFAEEVGNYLKEKYKEKRSEHPNEIMTRVERFIVLQVLDAHWKEHLYNIDQLREGISLRSYAEKKPLIEFKREGFALFEETIIQFRLEAIQMLFAARLKENSATQEKAPVAKEPNFAAYHSEKKNIFTNEEDSAPNQLNPSKHQTTQVATAKKIGRNDPCFCGSGKKYKHCHLR